MTRQMKKQTFVLAVIFCFTIVLSACTGIKNAPETSKKVEPVSKTELLLGTVCKITIYDKPSDEIFEKAFDRLKDIENKMSINMEKSEVININKNAGLDSVKVSDDTFYVIQKGLQYSELSGGNFDITIGPFVKLWNIGTENARVPSQKEIDDRKPLIGYKDVNLSENDKKVMLNKKGMLMDLGAIAKGYAADAVAVVLRENGVKHAIINLGGNVLTVGNKVDGSNWRIGVQNPFSDRGEYIGTIEVVDKSIVSSGSYERYFEQDGKRYHHILSPFTGYPVDNNLVGVSIISDKSVDGDGLSTTTFALGLEKGKQLIESLDGVDAVFVTKDSEVYITSGLVNNFNITDNNFKLK